MEITQRRHSYAQAKFLRVKSLVGVTVGCILGAGFFSPQPTAAGVPSLGERHTRGSFRERMPLTVRAHHPAIVSVANAIRAVTSDPIEQIVMVNDVTHLLVDYDDDERVYGVLEFHATFEEMLTRRRQGGWLYLRDDCDGRAVFAAHLLGALGIPWELQASYWKEHAWIVARVNGVEYDLLDLRKNAPETDRLSYKLFGHMFVRPSRRPPAFSWRRAWAQRTGRDFQIGLTLGLLSLESKPNAQKERYATDWTKRAPHGELSPIDDRALSARIAGFPFGEPRSVSALASQPAAKPRPAALDMGVATGSPSSAEQ